MTGYRQIEDLIRVLESGYRMEKPEHAPKAIGDLMFQCWKRNPEERITFVQLTEVLGEMVHPSSLIRFAPDAVSTRNNLEMLKSRLPTVI